MNNFFNEVLDLSWKASFLIIAIIVARILMKKMPKYFRKILWGLVGVRLIFPFSIESIFSLHPGDNITVGNFTVQQNATATMPADENTLTNILPIVWLGIFIALIIYGTASYIKLKLKISDAVRDKDNVYLSEKVDSPFVCGFFKPKIYFPYKIDEDVKNCVLLHEQTHIKNGDHILKAISFVLLCFYWFNPLVWISYFLFCKDIELACDEAVLKNYSKENRTQYAKAILEIGINKVRLSACPVAFGEVSIKERVKNALSYKKSGKFILIAAFFICLVIGICFMTEPVTKPTDLAQKPKTEEIEKPVVTEPKVEETTEPVTEPATTEPIFEVHTMTHASTEKETEVQEKTYYPFDNAEEVSEFESIAHSKMQENIDRVNSQYERGLEEYYRTHGRNTFEPATRNVALPEVIEVF